MKRNGTKGGLQLVVSPLSLINLKYLAFSSYILLPMQYDDD